MIITEVTPELEALLEYIKRSRGFDFTGYKRSTLTRRIRRRMQVLPVQDYTEYMEHLELDREEFGHLFDTILINVTAFFRDPAAWEQLASTIIPIIVAGRAPDEPIRVWSAGCSSGQEPYTAAIVLAEALGLGQFAEQVKIYATDVDEEALAQARAATYGAKDVEDIPRAHLEKYFEPANGSYRLRRELRASVIFGRLDLVQDAPISRVDLLICRNTLMYFNVEAQAAILSRFKFALNEGGFLFLGKAETLLTHPGLFTPRAPKWRVFTKSRADIYDRLPGVLRADEQKPADRVDIREAAFDSATAAQVVLDPNGCVALANAQARSLFSLAPRDLGRPLRWPKPSQRSDELRSCIEQALLEHQPVSLHDFEWRPRGGEVTNLDVQIAPLLDSSGASLGVSIALFDATRHKRLQEGLAQVNQELETTSEELQSANEELETTNEELQSTVEELETTNEELQTTNEEMDTMNEELQSTNQELRTLNEEVRQRGDELARVNAFLNSVLGGLRGGVVVVNRDLRIENWTLASQDLWGLRSDEVEGKEFLRLDIGLPVEQLTQPIRDCLSGASDYREVTLVATNRRGRSFQCAVICTPLGHTPSDIRGVIMLMEDRGMLE